MPKPKPKSRKIVSDPRTTRRELKEAIARLSWLRSLTASDRVRAGMTLDGWQEQIQKAKQVVLEYESPSIQTLRDSK